MNLMRKYRFYKRALQVFLFLNVFFMVLGILATVHYFQDHQASSLELSLVGAGVFVFGFLMPALLLWALELLVNHMRKKMLEHISKVVVAWTDSLKSSNGEALKSPLFWSHMALVVVEEFGKDFDHPMMSVFLEISPYIRQEIKNRTNSAG